MANSSLNPVNVELAAPASDPNQAQRRASDPARSVWVSASAGSGKTTVLTSRVVRLLLDGVQPQKILCLTYTRAAAAEMTLRIMQRLEKWVLCDEDTLRADLDQLQGVRPLKEQLDRAPRLYAQVLACPGGMRIRTIHAFAQEILGRFPLEAGLPPHFTLIDDSDLDRYKQAAFHAVIAEANKALTDGGTNSPSNLSMALRHLAVRVDAAALQKLVHDLASQLMGDAMDGAGSEDAQQGINQIIHHLAERMDISADCTVSDLIANAVRQAPVDALRIAALSLLEGGSPTHKERATKLLHWLSLSMEERVVGWAGYLNFFLKKDEQVPRAQLANSKWIDKNPEHSDLFNHEAQRLADVQDKINIVNILADTKALYFLAECYARHFARQKQDRGGIDYDDMIAVTQKLLMRSGIAPWILYKLDGGVDHILVDEAQDTSLAQWAIITSLAREFFTGDSARSVRRTLFVVGDEKQSIFSFQGAAPEAFLAMRVYFSGLIADAGQALDIIDMNTSFRSAPAVLRAVDAVFDNDIARQGVSSAVMRHNPAAKRSAAAAPKLGRVELWPLIPRPKKDKGEILLDIPSTYAGDHDQETILADQVAGRIKELLDSRTKISGMDRPLAPRDFMILLSRRGRLADLLVRALKARAIPVTGVDRMQLLEQLPVMDVLSLLKFILLPADDLNLAALLRSPLINLSEDQLMRLAAQRDGSLWQALQGAGADPALAAVRDYLLAWLGVADYETPFAFLSAILTRPCPASAISGRQAIWSRLGEDALDPLNELLSAALAFSTTSPPSLQLFLHGLETSDREIKREMELSPEDAVGQVRIMTVHASKGLEAPVVILANAAYTPGAQKMDRLIPCCDVLTLILRKPKNGLALAAYEKATQLREQEHRRLLYVALTRAAHLLIVAGCEPHQKNANAWYGLAEQQWLKYQDKPEAEVPADVLVIEDDGYNDIPPTGQVAPVSGHDNLLPPWLHEKARPENRQSIANPSRLDQTAVAAPDSSFTRGRIIHRLLQSLPSCPRDRWEDVARRYLANPEHRLTEQGQHEIVAETLALLSDPTFAPLFSTDSRAEVPIVGKVDGQIFSGQIDRLCVFDDAVWVVDYKTNRPPPATVDGVPAAYRAQMDCYRTLLRQIYPGRTIRCFLLWTYAPKLMELQG